MLKTNAFAMPSLSSRRECESLSHELQAVFIGISRTILGVYDKVNVWTQYSLVKSFCEYIN